MRFVAKAVDDSVNVSDTNPLVEASYLIAGIGVMLAGLAVLLVFLIELALHFVSPEDEATLFEDWLPNDLIVVEESDVGQAQTQLLVDRLASHWPDSPYQFHVIISESEASNAMALPGGLMIVTAGLLDQVESENELAFVLGHELGHFANRDHLRALGRGVMFSLLFAFVTGNDVSGLSINIADLTLRGFGRRQETAADEFGLDIVFNEYGHVNEAWRLFQRWESEEESHPEGIAYFSTHPDTGDRITALMNYAAERGWSTTGEITPLER